MRVLYLNPFSQQVSGPDESLLTLLAELIPMGVEAHVVLPRPGPQVPRYEKLGAKVHYAPLTVLKRRMGVSAAALPFQLVRGALAVAALVRRERIDLVHTNMEVVLDGSIVSRVLRLPHVIHYRGNTNGEPRLAFDALTRFWTATAEKVFCISEATAEIFRARGRGEKVEVLYNGVALERFATASRSDEVRAELGAGPADLLVGTIGRIHPRKDLETFLRAAAIASGSLPSAKFAVVGSAEAPEEIAYERTVRAVAGELDIAERVRFTGARVDVPRVLKALDVFVLTSRHEGFGRVVAEAMAAGTPVIVTNEGAPRELVQDGHDGFHAEPASPSSFAKALTRIADDPDLRRHAASNAQRSAVKFAARSVAGRVLDAYRNADRVAGEGA